MKYIDEKIEEYRNSIARALAGHLTGKDDRDLDDSEVLKAAEVAGNVPTLEGYMELFNALDSDDVAGVEDILNPETYESIEPTMQTELLDRDILEHRGFNFYGMFEDNVRPYVERYLDENNVEYMHDGSGQYNMKFADRNSAFKAEAAINKLVRKNNPKYVRDSRAYEAAPMPTDRQSDTTKRIKKRKKKDEIKTEAAPMPTDRQSDTTKRIKKRKKKEEMKNG